MMDICFAAIVLSRLFISLENTKRDLSMDILSMVNKALYIGSLWPVVFHEDIVVE